MSNFLVIISFLTWEPWWIVIEGLFSKRGNSGHTAGLGDGLMFMISIVIIAMQLIFAFSFGLGSFIFHKIF